MVTFGSGSNNSGWSAPVTSVSYSPGASVPVLACTDAAGTLRLLDLRAPAEPLLACRGGSAGGARSAAFDASGAVVAVASDDGRVRCYAADGRTGHAAGALLAELDASGEAGGGGGGGGVAWAGATTVRAPSVNSVAFDRWGEASASGSASSLLVAGLSDGSWVAWGAG